MNLISKDQTILVVDDNRSNIDVILNTLQDYDIIPCIDGYAAIEIAQNDNVDLILLDILMPNINGYEVCKILKQNPKTSKIPIIFLTAKHDAADIQKAFELGGVDYITKPFNSYELLSRIRTHLELRNYQINLEHKVEEELKKSQDKDTMIFHQSKLISMGEMIENIAHQWRQPLSQVNSAVMAIDGILHEKKIINIHIEEKLSEIESMTHYMSQTIDDFRNFFDKKKNKEKFKLKNTILNSISTLKASLNFHNIDVELNLEENIIVDGYPNELQQVILVLFNNAKDILLLRNIKNPKIIIQTTSLNNKIKITVCDNAGGIDENIINKIFEPYFTTKHKAQGTGLGLYISKMIVEGSMKAKLNVKNIENGVCFSIEFN